MDFIVSYHLYSQIKKKEKMKEKISNGKKHRSQEEPEIDNNKVNYTCPRCGQDPYFCQCKNNIREMYKYFQPEKDIY
jgi:hypothetical protein